ARIDNVNNRLTRPNMAHRRENACDESRPRQTRGQLIVPDAIPLLADPFVKAASAIFVHGVARKARPTKSKADREWPHKPLRVGIDGRGSTSLPNAVRL